MVGAYPWPVRWEINNANVEGCIGKLKARWCSEQKKENARQLLWYAALDPGANAAFNKRCSSPPSLVKLVEEGLGWDMGERAEPGT